MWCRKIGIQIRPSRPEFGFQISPFMDALSLDYRHTKRRKHTTYNNLPPPPAIERSIKIRVMVKFTFFSFVVFIGLFVFVLFVLVIFFVFCFFCTLVWPSGPNPFQNCRGVGDFTPPHPFLKGVGGVGGLNSRPPPFKRCRG